METQIENIPFRLMDGSETTLAAYAGKVVLIVNVASECGLTPQYEGSERLFVARRDEGLVVLGFPANDFGGQEPANNETILRFCKTKFGVEFPLGQKIAVTGAGQHPLYAALTRLQPEAIDPAGGALRAKLAGYGFRQAERTDVLWNFEKFLIGRDGGVVARFSPDVEPDDPVLVAAIARELGTAA